MTEFWTAVSAVATGLSALIAAVALLRTVQIANKQILLEQRQQIIPLWGFTRDFKRIDPSKPVWPDVVEAANRLELIAIAWEGEVIDRQILRRMYERLFIDIYNDISKCSNPPTGYKSGTDMLLDCPSAMRLYNEFMKDLTEGRRVAPLKG